VNADAQCEEALALNARAVGLVRDGAAAAAEPLLRRAAQLYEAAGADLRPEYVAVLQNLAAVARRLGDATQMRAAYLRVAEAERRRWPETDPQRADALNDVAFRLFEAGDDAAAEVLVAESLELRRRLMGDEDPDVASSLNNLGQLRLRAGDFVDARRLMERAADIRRALLSDAHPDLADSWSSLGGLALSEGDGPEAERMFALALEVLAALLGPEDPQVADVYENLARARLLREDRPGASLALRRAVGIRRRSGGTGESEARALNTLADAHYRAEEWSLASDLYTEAIALLEAVYGPDDPRVGDYVNNLANAERASGSWETASELYERALRIQRAHGRSDDSRVARVLADIDELRELTDDVPPDELLARAISYEREGDYPAAERLARRAVDVRSDSAGRDDETVAEALLVLGTVLNERADHEGARSAYDRALTATRTAENARVDTVAALLAGVGNVENRLGDPFAAERWHRESLALLEANGGPRNRTYPAALRNLAIDLTEQGDLLEARGLLERTIELLERQGDERGLGGTLTNLGRVRLRLGDPEGAEPLLDRALPLLQRTAGAGHPDVAATITALADANEARGKAAKAETRLRDALDIVVAALGEHHPRTLTARRRLAITLQSNGDDSGAEEQLLAALAGQRERHGDHPASLGATLVALGNLYASNDRASEALPLLTEGTELLRSALPPGHPSVVTALASIGSLYAAISPEAAEHFLQKALDGARGGHDDHAATVAHITATLALLKRARGDLDGASELLDQALAGTPGDAAGILTAIASLRAAQGATTAALDVLERAFALRDDAFADVLSAAPERTRLAFLASHKEMLALLLSIVAADPSPEAVKRGFDVVLGQKALAAEAAVTHREEILSGRHPELVDRLRELTRVRDEQARALLSGSTASEATDLRDRREALERSLASSIPGLTLTQRVRAASRAAIVAAMPHGSTVIEIVQHVVDDLRPTGGLTRAEWFSRRRGYERSRYVAFVLSSDPDLPVRLVNLGDAQHIDELIGRFRLWITGDAVETAHFPADRSRSLAEAGPMLHAAVFEPLERVLGDSRRLLIAPDGELTRLPFEALPDGDGGNVIDRYAISYVSAARDIVRFGVAHGRQQSPPVVVADPEFELRAPGDPATAVPDAEEGDVRFARLTGTREEGHLVANLLGAERLFGYRAVESAIKAVRAPKVLHLATHGWFLADRAPSAQSLAENDPLISDIAHLITIPGFGTHLMDVADKPKAASEVSPRSARMGAGQSNPLLRSGLALAGANTWLDGGRLPAEAQDGLLTAEDVSALDLYGTDLVVLSACETGLGEVVRGEGVFGLRRAFVLAGASTLVMSLWKVPDAETAELITDFYRRMRDGSGPAEALRRAQLTIKARPNLAEPYYWAAFVCQGDPGPRS